MYAIRSYYEALEAACAIQNDYYRAHALTGLLLAANLVVANIILRTVDKRWDLTEDKRFEISDNTQDILDRIESYNFV